MRDNRWNAIALLILRGLQLVLVVSALGLTAYFTATYTVRWYSAFTLATICLSLCWFALTLGLFFTNNLLPLAVLIGDILLAILYIVSIAAIADYNSDAIAGNCTFYSISLWTGYLDLYELQDCDKLRGLFAVLVLEMLTFIGAIIWDSIVLYQNRNGRPGGDQVVSQNAMYDGGAGVGTHGMSKPVIDANGGDAGGYHGGQIFPPQYQPPNSSIYPAQIASPATLYNPHMPPPLPPTMPQQAVMMQHQDQQQQQQIHQAQQQQQHQYQQQSQHQHQQQQNQGPLPQELVGTN